MSAPRHRFGEHTGEVELIVEASTLAPLFEEAARGLAGLLAEDTLGPPTRDAEHITLTASDPETLLIEWLNELVYRGEVNGCIYADVEIERIDERSLEATVRGREPRAPRTAVKAATWHGVRIRPRDGGALEATVVLDV